MPESYIEERPRLITEASAEFPEVFNQFTRFVLSQAFETQQALADIRAGDAPLKGSEGIHENVGQMLALTRNGRDIEYDEATQKAFFDDKEYSDIVNRFRKLDKDDPETERLRQNVAVLGLGIYAVRAVQYKKQRKNRNRVA